MTERGKSKLGTFGTVGFRAIATAALGYITYLQANEHATDKTSETELYDKFAKIETRLTINEYKLEVLNGNIIKLGTDMEKNFDEINKAIRYSNRRSSEDRDNRYTGYTDVKR